MRLRHANNGHRTLCGQDVQSAASLSVGLEWCPTCAARDAASRLGGFTWVTCIVCRGTGSVARTDSPVTSCFACGNAGLYPSIRQGWCSCGHWQSKHDEHAGCLEGGCGCTSYESTA